MSDKKAKSTALGRPTAYKTEHDQMAYDFLAGGKSIIQLGRELGVARSTIYKWAEVNPSFSDILEVAREHSQAFWEDRLEEMMYSKEVNAPLVKLYFANRFKWHDKPEVDEDETKAQSLNVTFDVKPAVGDVKVTNAKAE